MKKVLVFAVHPDDESLACGGTLLRHIANGDEVHWRILTSPKESEGFAISYQEKQKETIRAVAEAYPFSSFSQCDFPAASLSSIPEGVLVRELSRQVQELRPEIVYLPFYGDVHGDHRAAFNAAYSSVKPFRCPFIERVLMIETLSETDQALSPATHSFSPNCFVDIAEFIERKIEILSLFETEMHPPPFPRSLEAVRALARVRGATIASEYAEAFCLLRECQR